MNNQTKTPVKFNYRRVKCQYCQLFSKIISGALLYGEHHKLSEKEFYYCEPCEAWVGMHVINKKPFGTLAKIDLRKKRALAHSAFDKIWITDIKNGSAKGVARKKAYSWLAEELNMPIEQCHIGNFNIEDCNKVLVLCLKRKA